MKIKDFNWYYFFDLFYIIFSQDNGRIYLIKVAEKSCKLIITSATKADEGIWRGVVTLLFRRNARMEHHNSNVTVVVQGKHSILKLIRIYTIKIITPFKIICLKISNHIFYSRTRHRRTRKKRSFWRPGELSECSNYD